MAGTLKTDIVQTDTIRPTSVSGTVTLGASGETISIPSGATFSATAGTMSGHNYPAFRAYRSTSQTITNTTITKIQFDTETFDTDSAYDNSTNYRFTPQVAGKYFFHASVRMSSFDTAVTNYQVYLYKNGSLHSRYGKESVSFASPTNSVSDIITMNGSTDYVEAFVYHNYGGDRDIAQDSVNTFFLGYRIGS